MTRFLIPVSIFCLFLVEGTWFEILFPQENESGWVWMPRFALIGVVLTSIYRGPVAGVWAGVFVGFLYDFTYTQILGIYTFCFGFIAYMSSYSLPVVRNSYGWQWLIIFCALFVFELIIYFIYFLLGIAGLSFGEFLVKRMIASWLINGAAALLLLVPFRRIFDWIENQEKIRQR
ncbi:rod shape-determining protein MreD [Marinococcus halophilus]|uniref:Uncharacterized protein n=1 Tax=Marinococcus halophilus TaxID=1371 RepID=A0A510Y6G0_MARHA|nr:rod shape-determining protein MreD [Marinococcus halophilus]OZT80022.1 rod shape-determining protein MreD [Marinococcus halophilus]GEK58057.1 hypothetical protein MHA01_09620 [Marinococcus halophilus]